MNLIPIVLRVDGFIFGYAMGGTTGLAIASGIFLLIDSINLVRP